MKNFIKFTAEIHGSNKDPLVTVDSAKCTYTGLHPCRDTDFFPVILSRYLERKFHGNVVHLNKLPVGVTVRKCSKRRAKVKVGLLEEGQRTK